MLSKGVLKSGETFANLRGTDGLTKAQLKVGDWIVGTLNRTKDTLTDIHEVHKADDTIFTLPQVCTCATAKLVVTDYSSTPTPTPDPNPTPTPTPTTGFGVYLAFNENNQLVGVEVNGTIFVKPV